MSWLRPIVVAAFFGSLMAATLQAQSQTMQGGTAASGSQTTGGGAVPAGSPTMGGGATLQTENYDSANVKTGEYRDLTIWRQLKLGTAPLVNPGLRSEIAYKYEPAEFFLSKNADALKDLFLSGQLGLAKHKDSAYNIVDPNSEEGLATLQAFLSAGQSASSERFESYVLVSKDDHLLGAQPGGRVVTWNAGRPLPALKPVTPDTAPKQN